MSIRYRIQLLIILTFVAIFSIGGYSIFQSNRNASEVKTVTEGVVPSALAFADLIALLKEVQVGAFTVVTAPDANLAAEANEKLTKLKAELQAGLELQSAQAISQAQKGLAEEAKESLTNYFNSINDATKFKLAGNQEFAMATLFGNVAEYQKEMEGIASTMRIEKNRSKDSAIETLNKNLSNTVYVVLAITVCAILVLSTIGMFLYRQIVHPISQMQKMMSEIADNQDFTHRLPVVRKDEIGNSIVAFNSMIAKIQESSSQLKQKTTDIQTMLQNMPQGILTVAEGNVVHPEYSTYLETIFETQEIAGRDVMNLVFSNTNLGADILSQVEAIGGACIGEDVMNFEFNSHLMVGEIEKKMPDGRVKILDLNWSPITNDENTTVRLLLCVRDVTELRKLAAEAGAQKRELEIIGEILAVSQEKFQDFIFSSIKFIDENEILIRKYAGINAEAIDCLFRNMHTVKGNARTYGLLHLTNVVHIAEKSYNELRKPNPEIAWDQNMLLAELASVRDTVEHYAKVNDVSLGRKGAGRRGDVERYLMVDKAKIFETIHRLETVNTNNLHELVAARDAVHQTLRLLGTEPIGEALNSVLDSLPSLAKELGKLPPMIEVEDNGYVVRSQAAGLLKNVFMHLFRNSMDHGLETPEERMSKNKPASGTIQLQLDVVDNMFQMKLSDDGRGIALARVKKIAVEKGLISDADLLADEEIAKQIFRAGFSTAEKVTEVSGRGVGLDAVQDFIKRENGKIEIHFLNDDAGKEFRQFETAVYLPLSFCEHVDGFDYHYNEGDKDKLVAGHFGDGHKHEEEQLMGDMDSTKAA